MKPSEQILATIYAKDDSLVLNEKIGTCYFQALPRVGETIIVKDFFEQKFEVISVTHISTMIASTDSHSYNMNDPRLSEVHLLCIKLP